MQLVQEVAHKRELTEAAIVFLILVSFFFFRTGIFPGERTRWMLRCDALCKYQYEILYCPVKFSASSFLVNSRVTSWTLWAPFLSFCFFGLLLYKCDEQLRHRPRILASSLCCKCVHVYSGQFQGSVITKAWVPLHYCIGIFIFIQYIVTFCKDTTR